MIRNAQSRKLWTRAAFALILCSSAFLNAQVSPAVRRITTAVNNDDRVVLSGTIRKNLKAAKDLGPADPSIRTPRHAPASPLCRPPGSARPISQRRAEQAVPPISPVVNSGRLRRPLRSFRRRRADPHRLAAISGPHHRESLARQQHHSLQGQRRSAPGSLLHLHPLRLVPRRKAPRRHQRATAP